MRMTKRMLAFLLSFAMLFGMVATMPTAFAADDVLASFGFEGDNWLAEDSGKVTASPDDADKITQVAAGKNGAAADFAGLASHQGLR